MGLVPGGNPCPEFTACCRRVGLRLSLRIGRGLAFLGKFIAVGGGVMNFVLRDIISRRLGLGVEGLDGRCAGAGAKRR
jgi:hypothetical protein